MSGDDPALPQFAGDYRRLLGAAEWAERLLPEALHPIAARWLAERWSPYLARRQTIVSAFTGALGLDESGARVVWQQWLQSHGLFALTVFRYGRLSRRWLDEQVSVSDPALLSRVVRDGGLVMTYHTHHHNTLGCVLGLSGCHITGLAESPAKSPLYPFLGEYVERINRGSASHFGGGDYLFTDQIRTLVQTTRRLLQEGKVIVSLSDFDQGGSSPGAAVCRFLGRRICPPAGAVEMALAAGAPIYSAAMFPVRGRFVFDIREISTRKDAREVLQQYFFHLESVVRTHPWAWQGWDWYHALPLENADA